MIIFISLLTVKPCYKRWKNGGRKEERMKSTDNLNKGRQNLLLHNSPSFYLKFTLQECAAFCTYLDASNSVVYNNSYWNVLPCGSCWDQDENCSSISSIHGKREDEREGEWTEKWATVDAIQTEQNNKRRRRELQVLVTFWIIKSAWNVNTFCWLYTITAPCNEETSC